MIMKVLRITGFILIFVLLTILTQTGGVELLLFWLLWRRFRDRFEQKWIQNTIGIFSFLSFHAVFAFFVIPLIAPFFGRQPLPVSGQDSLQPLNILTCYLNRHYVTPELYASVTEASNEMNQSYPGTKVAYLDAGFPFFDGFPLFPHLSHDDGEKLDLTFFYKDAETGKAVNGYAPSLIGYGVYEAPLPGEYDQPKSCEQKGYWQYSLLSALVPQWRKEHFELDPERTKKIIELLTKQSAIQKIFIEPHLKLRMNLQHSKIRFHGCQAVRHDDHIHIQL